MFVALVVCRGCFDAGTWPDGKYTSNHEALLVSIVAVYQHFRMTSIV